MNLPQNYLSQFKLQIKYFYDDLDELLTSQLEVSALNILNQYLELKEEELSQQALNELLNDKRFKLATLHLATSLYENPDLNNTLQFGSVIDSNNIFRILGSLIQYYK